MRINVWMELGVVEVYFDINNLKGDFVDYE